MIFSKATLLQTGLVLAITASMFISAPVALAKSKSTVARGNVYNESNGGKGIGGLTVTVQCLIDDKITVTKTAVTDSFGLYTVTFSSDCDQGDPITSTVTFNGQTQSETALVSSTGTETNDFYFGSVGVSEFSGLTIFAAFLISAGAYIFLKKKSFV